MQEPEVIEILSSESKVIIISNSDTILADVSTKNDNKSASSNKLLIYLTYSRVSFACPTKISHIEIMLIQDMPVPENSEMLHYLDA